MNNVNPYEYAEEDMQNLGFKSGDIVIFSISSGLGLFTAVSTLCPWVHAAMIVKCPKDDSIWLFHVTQKRGVHLNPLHEIMTRVKGNCIIRRLKTPLSENQLRILHEHVVETVDDDFDADLGVAGTVINHWLSNIPIAGPALGDLFIREKKEQRRTWACTEIVLEGYRKMGFPVRSFEVGSLAPVDFTSKSKNKLFGKSTDSILYEEEKFREYFQ